MNSKILSVLLLLISPFLPLSGEENFYLIDDNRNELILEFGPSVNERVTPCSSFKIALCLMGFDSEILKDKQEPIWDFKEGYVDYIDSWKASQSPQSWIKNSCVWYSQILTTELGLESLQHYLELFEYGNQDLSGGLTKAWLGSSLKISPKEQVAFIQKIVRGEIDVSADALEKVKPLFFVDDLPGGWKLFGKTGFGHAEDLEIGWFVGWVEKGDKTLVFAYNIRDLKTDSSQRVPKVKQLLVESNAL